MEGLRLPEAVLKHLSRPTLATPTRPEHGLFVPLPSGQRNRAVKTCANRLKNSFTSVTPSHKYLRLLTHLSTFFFICKYHIYIILFWIIHVSTFVTSAQTHPCSIYITSRFCNVPSTSSSTRGPGVSGFCSWHYALLDRDRFSWCFWDLLEPQFRSHSPECTYHHWSHFGHFPHPFQLLSLVLLQFLSFSGVAVTCLLSQRQVG